MSCLVIGKVREEVCYARIREECGGGGGEEEEEGETDYDDKEYNFYILFSLHNLSLLLLFFWQTYLLSSKLKVSGRGAPSV